MAEILGRWPDWEVKKHMIDGSQNEPLLTKDKGHFQYKLNAELLAQQGLENRNVETKKIIKFLSPLLTVNYSFYLVCIESNKQLRSSPN